MFRAEPAAAVRERDDLQQMTNRFVEIHATAIVPAIDLARSLAERIGPEGKSPLLDAAENVIELGFAYQKGEMPGRDGLVRLDEVERRFDHLHDREVGPFPMGGEPDERRQEFRRTLLVPGMNDTVIQRHWRGRAADGRVGKQ